MVAKISDYSQVYSALTGNQRKIPARVLRFFKEQLYELIHAPVENEKKIAVVDYEDIGSIDDVEFVIGAGVAKRHDELTALMNQASENALAKKGYAGVTVNEVFLDCLLDKSQFLADDLLSTAYPNYARSSRTFMPIFRYLREVGIDSEEKLLASKYEGAKKIVKKMKGADYTWKSYQNRFDSQFSGLKTQEIIDKASSPIEALLMIAFQPDDLIDLDRVRSFLEENGKSFNRVPYETAYRKLICRFDRLAFGF